MYFFLNALKLTFGAIWCHINKTEKLNSVSISIGIKMVSNIQVCVNTMPRRKDISNDLRETAVAAHQSGKGCDAISIQLFGVNHSTVSVL